MDKTLINILTMLISGSGLFVALTKFNVPQVNQSFWGTNPFIIKRDKINSVMTWTFSWLATVGLLLQLGTEIFGKDLQQRLYSNNDYFAFTICSSGAMVVVVYLLTKVGREYARVLLQPLLVDSQKELFEKSKFVVENGGWTKEQLPHKDNYKSPKTDIKKNFDQAHERIERIENLLDIKHEDLTLEQRIVRLTPIFNKT